MGLFDSIGKMFGFGSEPAESDTQKFARLKGKYVSALNVADELGVRIDGLYVEGDKLVVRGTAPSEEAMNQTVGAFQNVDGSYSDLDIQVGVSAPAEQTAATAAQSSRTYSVQSGDSLWKIAKNHYGDGGQYMKIFYANRDQISDPDRINVGQQLVIPE